MNSEDWMISNSMTRTLVGTAAAALFTIGVAAQSATKVELKNAKGEAVGSAAITAAGSGVSIALDVKGLTPGEHGIHVHGVAKCEAPGFTTAGPHFNPDMKKHGMQNPEGPHAGDMMNFTVAADGTAKTTVTDQHVSLGTGANSIFANGGTALVIHAGPDDMKTDPSGNSGDRIACGTITK
jgi:Cu-Zn family superoxide dismutase